MDYHFDKMEDIKLIILNVIDDFNIPVPNAMIVDTVLTHSYADYFDILQYIYELAEAELITYYTEDDVRYYSLTHRGREAMEYFSLQIPLTVREKLFKTAREKAKELRESQSVVADVVKENDFEYTVNLKITELGYDLFSLSLRIGSEKAAKAVAARFKRDSENIYSQIFSGLIEGCEF